MKVKTSVYTYDDCSECITIEPTANGGYWIMFGANGTPYGLNTVYSPTYCGAFKTEREAIQTMLKLRPRAQLWDIF